CRLAEPQFLAPRCREKGEGMMLVVTAQKRAPFILPFDFFGQSEAGDLLIPALRRFIVVDEKIYRTDPSDLERLGEQYTIDGVFKRHRAHVAPTVKHVDAFLDVTADELVVGKLRLCRWIRSSMSHRHWAGVAVPADLLDAVI